MMGLRSWLRGAMQRLIGKTEIEGALRTHTALSDEMNQAIMLWRDMYHNCPPWKSNNVLTLNIPAIIASKVAKMVTMEAEYNITGGARANWISEQFSHTWANLRAYAEYAVAKGGLVFKPYIDGTAITVDCIQADRFFPITYDSNKMITGGVFVAQKTVGNTIYTRLERQEYKNGRHTISQQAFRSNTVGTLGAPCPLSAVDDWADIQAETWVEGVNQPLFVYWGIPFANNIDDASPLGVSVYSKASETIEQLDRQYSRLVWEFEGGELAVHASLDMFKPKPGGKTGEVELPRGKQRLYRLLDDGISDQQNFFETYAPAFRDESLLNGFNTLLRQIEQQCGLAHGVLSNPESVEKTATEIVSSKQESYSTIVDIQKSLEVALVRLLASIDALGSAGRLAPAGGYQAAFSWDDSIVVDKEAKRQQYWQYVSSGKFPFWAYLVKFEGYTEKEAKQVSQEPSMTNPYGFRDENNATS